MTRHNKCDACRKAKVKCDELLPACSGCLQKGRECTRNRNNKTFSFIEYGVDPDKPSVAPLRRNKQTAAMLKTRPLQLERSRQFSEEYSLLARWVSMLHPQEQVDDTRAELYQAWEVHVPSHIGKCRAINNAARYFMDCRQAFANPTDANLKAVSISNVAALTSIRIVLSDWRPGASDGDILLAIQMLYMGEAILMRMHNAVLVHMSGLLRLLEQHRKRLKKLDDKDSLISSALFWCNMEASFTSAVMLGQDHELDNPTGISIPPLPLNVPGISEPNIHLMGKDIAQSFILVPRLIRKVRRLGQLPHDYNLEQETIELAKRIYYDEPGDILMAEALRRGELWHEPTADPRAAKFIPMSYSFRSRPLSMMLAAYWSIRMCIYGLLETLSSLAPASSFIFSIEEVHAKDAQAATNAVMSAEHTLAARSSDDRFAIWADHTRLQKLLQMGFGAWDRLERRSTGLVADGPRSTPSWASGMKELSMDLSNKVLTNLGVRHMSTLEMEKGVLYLAGRHVPGVIPIPNIED